MSRVMIVDDERNIRITLGEFLQREGYETEVVGDAESAQRAFLERPCDVVLSDIVLPGGTGIDLVRQIRSQDPDVQVIVMTGMPDVSSAVGAVRAGAFDYLIKPVNRNAVLRAVGNAVRHRQVAVERDRLAKENRAHRENLERLVRERTAALEAEIAERRQIEANLRRAMSRLEVLRRIDQAILLAESSRDVVRGAIRRLGGVIRCRQLTAILVDTPVGTASLLACRPDEADPQDSGDQADLAECLPPEAAREARLLRIEDLGEETPLAAWGRGIFPEDVRSCVALPLRAQGELLGILALGAAAPGELSAEDAEAAREVADQLAIALHQARLHERIRAHAWELELRVTERTAALELANRNLQAATQAKSKFLASMSHELRTPLNGILGFSQLLLEHGEALPAERRSRYAQNIQKSGNHLLQLINDILDLSKVEAGKIVLQPSLQRLPELLEDVLVIIRGLANQKSQRLEVVLAPDLPPLRADGVRLKQICFNLLSNAVKFTPAGGTITLTARRSAECGVRNAERRDEATVPDSALRTPHSAIEIAVADSGAGIRAEDLPKLFQEFVQLDTTREQHQEGTGLGLALTKKLVELHGGTIRVESPGEGRGSIFLARLPVEAKAE